MRSLTRTLTLTTLEPRASLGLLILRVFVGGFMLISHGWPKAANYATMAPMFKDPIGVGSEAGLILAIFAELFCAASVMAGAATRLAAVPLVVTMAVAAFIVHAADPWARQEFALLYGIVFATLFFTGGGAYSVDGIVYRREAEKHGLAVEPLG